MTWVESGAQGRRIRPGHVGMSRRQGEDAGRFMESGVGDDAMLTDLEPGRIPGGETPPSTAGGTPAATEARFMESGLFETELLTGLEPGREHRWLPIPKGLRPKARGCEARATPG